MVTRKMLLFLILSLYPEILNCISYEDILELRKPCLGDNCIHGDENASSRTCQCDKECSLFNDCCIDSEHANKHKPYPVVCQTFGDISVYTISSCPRHFRNPKVRLLCHGNNVDQRDPFLFIPVVDPRTKITYKNRFCAICNGREDNLLYWQADLKLKKQRSENSADGILTENYILNNLIFNDDTQEWGVWTFVEGQGWNFHGFELIFQARDYIDRSIRKCTPDIISKCSMRWADSDIRENCNAYQGTIYFSKGYRNIHCAMCNFEDITSLHSCSIYTPLQDTASFTIPLDLNFNHEEIITGDDCDQEEVYDIFSKKCRHPICDLPGYTMVDGKCQSF